MKNLIKVQEELTPIWEKKIKKNKSLYGLSIVLENNAIAVCLSGTEEQIYTAVAHFLIHEPQYIKIFQKSIKGAKVVIKQNKL